MPDDSIESLSQADIATLSQMLRRTDPIQPAPRGGRQIEVVLFRAQTDGLKLTMGPDKNHQRPHFHIEYKRIHRASYDIVTFAVLAGEMPRKYEEQILDWAGERKNKLARAWEEFKNGQDPRIWFEPSTA